MVAPSPIWELSLLISPEFEGIKTPVIDEDQYRKRLLISPEFEGIKTHRPAQGCSQ